MGMSYIDPADAGTPAARGIVSHEWGVDVQQDIEYLKARTPAILAAPSPSGDTTGVTDRAAITALALDGTTVTLQAGLYYFDTLNFDGRKGLRLFGQGGRFNSTTGGLFGATELRCVQTGSGTGISARGTQGFNLDHIAVTYSSATYSGTLIDLSGNSGSGGNDTNSPTIGRDTIVRGRAGAYNAATLINLDQSLDADIRCMMTNAVKGIVGKASNSSYSNHATLAPYVIGPTAGVGGFSVAPIWNPDADWYISGVYEPLTSGAPGMCGHDSGVLVRGVTFEHCWTGDDTAAGSWITLAGSSIRINGNIAGANQAGSSFFKADGTVNGLEIGQNYVNIGTSSAWLINPNSQTLTGVVVAPQVWASTISLTASALPAGSRITDPNYPQGVHQVVAKQTLTGTAASITFSNIPQTGSLLRVTVLGRSDTAAESTNFWITVNGDSGGHYDSEMIYGQSTTSGSNTPDSTSGQWNASNVDCPGASATAGVAGRCSVEIIGYAATTFGKAGSWESGFLDIATATSDAKVYRGSIYWRLTTAINSIRIAPQAGNFVAGTIALLEIT